MLYDIKDIRTMIANRVLKFIGKLTRETKWSVPKQLLSCWCTTKRPQGGVQLTNKKIIIKALHRFYPSCKKILNYPIYINIDNDGSFKYWFKDACDKRRLDWLLKLRLQYPNLNRPEPPPDEPSQPSSKEQDEPPSQPSTEEDNKLGVETF